jgi:hypothetical protein
VLTLRLSIFPNLGDVHGLSIGAVEFWAWFKNGLFWVTQTIGILPPGKDGFDTEMKKTGRVSNPFRVQLKGAESA